MVFHERPCQMPSHRIPEKFPADEPAVGDKNISTTEALRRGQKTRVWQNEYLRTSRTALIILYFIINLIHLLLVVRLLIYHIPINN